MRILAPLGRFLASWYVAGPALAIAGIVIGYAVFFHAFPGKPKIGVIDIPYTALSEDSAAHHHRLPRLLPPRPRHQGRRRQARQSRRRRLPSEQLYIETRRLREEKPVVMVMNGMVASGGYMMALGANYTFSKTSTLVGNVGVVAGAPGVLPPRIPRASPSPAPTAHRQLPPPLDCHHRPPQRGLHRNDRPRTRRPPQNQPAPSWPMAASTPVWTRAPRPGRRNRQRLPGLRKGRRLGRHLQLRTRQRQR